MYRQVDNEPIADPALIVCPHADLLGRLPDLAPGGVRLRPALRQGAVAPW
jgi:hypothetical protein